MTAPRRRWPLIVIGAAAAASTWSGWVGLGSLTGFGVVKPLPGISDREFNTAITLPVGVEAYAIYALYVATSSESLTPRARKFAWVSSGAALALGMFGQAAYHLMTARGITSGPWPVVVAVSCLPVLVLGAASLLWHLAGEEADVSVNVPISDTAPAPVSVIEDVPAPKPVNPAPTPRRPVTVPDADLADIIAATLKANPAAGFPTVAAAIKDAGWLVGNTERVKDALRAAKNPGLRVVAGG